MRVQQCVCAPARQVSATLVVVWLGAQRVLDGTFSIGLLFAFLSYKDQFLGRVSELIDKAVDLTMLKLQAERLAQQLITTIRNAERRGGYDADGH